LLLLLFVLLRLVHGRKTQAKPAIKKRWKLLRDKPLDWKDAIYSPREFRRKK
jgi:hypothetical protein